MHPDAVFHIDDTVFDKSLTSRMLTLDLPFDDMEDAINRIDETINGEYQKPIYIYLPAEEAALFISREPWENVLHRQLYELGSDDRRFWDLLMTCPAKKSIGGDIDWDYKGEF
jgi:hypothetical protein